MSKITSVDELIKEARRQGYTVTLGGSGHWKFYKGPRLITTAPRTPSDKRGVRNCVSELGKTGFVRPDTQHHKRNTRPRTVKPL